MNDVHTLTISAEHANVRTDKAIATLCNNLSRTVIQKLLDDGLITRNGAQLTRKDKLHAGDVVEIHVPIVDNTLKAHTGALDILFEDDDLIAINKSANKVVHPGSGTGDDTLVHCLLAHCKLSSLGGEKRPGVVHRLDKDTTGVIVLAKSDRAYLELVQQFSKRQLHKEYRAIVCGVPTLAAGTISVPIGRDPRSRVKMAVVNSGRPALTDWWTIATTQRHALLGCKIHTGRTHQIRVHLKYLGHPILGDRCYGSTCQHADLPTSKRPLLHAYKLQLTHPVTRQPLNLCAPLPEDFLALYP